MRVTIIQNPASGDQTLSGSDLIDAVRRAGHQAAYASTEDQAAVAARLADPGDLVAIAGGDGTLRNVATRLIGRGVPITLLPTGTANNIGLSLGITGETLALIDAWHSAPIVPFDTGVVRGSDKPYPLIEGMGFGPIAVTIAALSTLTATEAQAAWTAAEVRRDLKVLREVLADYPVHECQVMLDDEDLSGDYILVEVMNVRSVGPNVALAPEASVSDGLFDLVLLTDADRTALRDYLTARLEGTPARLAPRVHRGRRVELTWHGSRVHIDDEVWPNEQDASSGAAWSRDGFVRLEVLMNPAALQMLVPDVTGGTATNRASSLTAPAT